MPQESEYRTRKGIISEQLNSAARNVIECATVLTSSAILYCDWFHNLDRLSKSNSGVIRQRYNKP